MPNTVAWNQDLSIIEIIFRQSITSPDLLESTAKALELAHDHNLTRFLVDISEADLVAPLVDVYDLPDKHYVKMGANRKNCIALIQSTSAKGMRDAEFYKNVCLNRGWMVQLFSNYEEAIEWLLSLH